MDLTDLIAALSRPQAYPGGVDRVVVRQTHISVVFLAGERAYKVKKPLDLGFLDFTTLERRRRFCHEEVRLNRRLAPQVYLGVLPVTRDADGVRLGGAGEVVDYAVEMVRLPDERTFEAHLHRGELSADLLGRLAHRLARFHAEAASGPEVSRWGDLATVAGNTRENFTQVEPYVGQTVSPTVFARLRDLTEAELARLGGLMEDRADRHVPRDTHGDLHLNHVYSFPEAAAPRDLVVVDCIEFNERFRFADPVADIAFLDMDLRFRGRPDLATAFGEAYLAASGDEEGRALLPFYSAYRAVVRGKVDGFGTREAEIPAAQRDALAERARSYFLLALGLLAPPPERPALILSAGLPGTGKSLLARWLAESLGFEAVVTDVVRKALAGLSPTADAAAPLDQGIYSPDWTERTYAEALRRTEALLRDGRRVVVDATFGDDARRRAFLALADACRVPALLLVCQAPPETIRERLAADREGASDADFGTYQGLADRWQAFGAEVAPRVRVVDTSSCVATTRQTALGYLAEIGLA